MDAHMRGPNYVQCCLQRGIMSYWAIAGYIFHLHTILRAEPTAEGGRKKKNLSSCAVCVCEREPEWRKEAKEDRGEGKQNVVHNHKWKAVVYE